MSYYVVLVAKHVIALCPKEDYQEGWEILGKFNVMKHAENFLVFVNSGGYSGYLPNMNDVHGVWIQPEIYNSGQFAGINNA